MKRTIIINTSLIIIIGLAVSIFIYTNFERTPPTNPASTNSELESSEPETNSEPETLESEASEPEVNSVPEIPYAEFPTDEQLAENPVGLENSLSDPPTDTQAFVDTINEETASEIDRILQEIHDNTLTPEDYLDQQQSIPETQESTVSSEPQQNQENVTQQGGGGAPRPSGWAIDPGTNYTGQETTTTDNANLGSGGYH